MHIEGKIKKNVLVISLGGELDHHRAGQVREYIDKFLENPTVKNLVLDTENLNFMDSSGLGVIIGRYKTISKRGGKLAVINVNSQIHRIFSVSGLYKIIKSYKGIEDALKDMGVY